MTISPMPRVFEISTEQTSIDCRSLWSAVLVQVITDLIPKSKKSAKAVASARIESIRWIGEWPSRDFREVCWLAGRDPDVLHPRMKAMVFWSEDRLREVVKRGHGAAIDCEKGA